MIGLALALIIPAVAAAAQSPLPAQSPGSGVSPPTPILGLDTPPMRFLEFSRAWLKRAAEVRERRSELHAKGELDGLDLRELARHGAALTGTLRIPVIPVRYADVPEPFPTSAIENRLFGPAIGDTMSLAAYWEEVSSGLLKVEGVVTPWIELSREASYYLPAREHGWARFGRIKELWLEALMAADRLVDFGRFDNSGPDGIPNSGDDNGYVDFLVILVATSCDQWREGAIWPHRGAMEPFPTTAGAANGGRIKVTDYVVLPVVDRTTCGPMHVGVLAHETAHAFGLPDLYDYDGSSHGIGAWGLMGTGAHTERFSPAHLGAWSKEQLGWVRVDWLDEAATELVLPPVVIEPRIYRYDLPGQQGEYLLFENRQRVGSDRRLPGHGMLAWRVNPDRGELGLWNTDARRRGVSLIEADGRGDLASGMPADAGDPFPGAEARRDFRIGGPQPLRLSGIAEVGGRIHARAEIGFSAPALVANPDQVWLTAGYVGANVSQAVRVHRRGGADLSWRPNGTEPWLHVRRHGDMLILEARTAGLPPGLYTDIVRLEFAGRPEVSFGTLTVRLNVPSPFEPQVVARGVSWSWGLAVQRGNLFQASYGWDPLTMHAMPRLLHFRDGQPEAATLARLPADALFSPVIGDAGMTYVLARAADANHLYRIEEDGSARLIAGSLSETPAYGAAGLADGSVLVADWEGRILRVSPSGRIMHWTDLNTNVYQIAVDETGSLYAAMFQGSVLWMAPDGASSVLQTGFEAGRLVAVAAAPGGGVFAAERGGEGRILLLRPDVPAEIVSRVPGAHFYGLAVDGAFLYALDLNHQEILRIPLDEAVGPRMVSTEP